MRKPKKAVQKLVPFRLNLAVVNRNQTDPELSDRTVILPPCSICGKPITDFDRAFLFTCLPRSARGPKFRRIGTIGEDQHPLLHDPATLYVGHFQCCDRCEARGSFTMFFRKTLNSVLKSDQRKQRDLVWDGLS